MKKIRLYISKIKNHYYAKIPDVIATKNDLSGGESIEVTIHNTTNDSQFDLWDVHPEDINEISYKIKGDVHTMNMYNRIYVPEKYRFFLPELDRDFILITDVGNIKTHLTSNGYFTKGLRQWFYVNGPIMPNDKLVFTIIDEHTLQYQMEYIKCKK